MPISFRKDKMSKGRLDNADVTFSNTAWITETAKKSGKELIWLQTLFIDDDAGEHQQRWLLTTSGERVVVNDDGALEDIDPQSPFQPSMNSGVGKLTASLEDLGVSPKTLDMIANDPSVLDGLKVHVEQRGSGRKDDQGKEYTDLIVTEIFEAKVGKKANAGKPAGKPTGKPAGKPAAGKKKPAVVEEEEEEVDELTQLTRDTLQTILSSPDEYVKNYDEDAGGITTMQANKAAFAASDAPAKEKGKIAMKIKDPEFLAAGAEAGLWTWDEDEGLIGAA